MKVKPNLFLNMSPQTIEEGGLAFARNMKLDDDGNLISDYGYKNIADMASYNIVGHIVGLNNKIYFLCATKSGNVWTNSKIVEYDEISNSIEELDTHWTYSGGEIDGYVSTNQSGEKILTIGEYIEEGSNIPLKHINLTFPKIIKNGVTVSDESIYYQAPKCPTANLILENTYVKTIPNGVYVFFIRYKLRKDVYTNWFVCSRPIFSGVSEKVSTIQGGLKYINLHKDSAKSFVFKLNFAHTGGIEMYDEFQLGFIITHDEATDARIWKSFKINNFTTATDRIYFDYEDVIETNIDDLLEVTYELYNVRNITSFKNKLYISNYKETNFNDDNCVSLANNISLTHVLVSGGINVQKIINFKGTDINYNYSLGFYGLNNSQIQSLSDTDFIFDISNLAKESTTEFKDIVTFDVKSRDNPDVARIYNVKDNSIYGIVLGDYLDDYGDGLAGLSQDYSSRNLYVFTIGNSNIHPWYDKYLTFAYGSANDSDTQSSLINTDIYLFKQGKSYTFLIAGIAPSIHIGWGARDAGYNEAARAFITDNIKKELSQLNKFILCYCEISFGTETYKIYYNDDMDDNAYVPYEVTNFDTGAFSVNSLNDKITVFSFDDSKETITKNVKDKIILKIIGLIKEFGKGINEDGNIVIQYDNNYISLSNISVKFKKLEFVVEYSDVHSDEYGVRGKYNINLITTNYSSLCSVSFKKDKITIDSNEADSINQESTLMPLSTYKAYAHFVTENNIITNGIPINGTISTENITNDNDLIKLKCSISGVSNSIYKSFFISLVNIGNAVIEGFGYTKKDGKHILNCLELDSLLYNINDNIIISDGTNTITSNAVYYSSGSSYPSIAFGNCGFVAWDAAPNEDYNNRRLYIIVERNKNNENINSSIRCSEYIPLTNVSNKTFEDGFYGSYFCKVKKPNFDLSYNTYVSGNDVYSVTRENTVKLTDFKNYINIQNSLTYFIRSNYNLNYLSLTEDLQDKLFSVGSASSGVKQVAKVINSINLSYIYELKSMYKDFLNKSFKLYDEDYKIDFDNTVRVSNVLSDETFNNSVFKFSPEDYYNVPTDRGIIVNLFSIGNNIFVHTKSSFYKFDGNQTISSNNNDIQLQESEPFNNGITQIIDSEYGYGGIDTKQSGCITFDSYFFYDKVSNHIFGYAGSTQIQLIDGNIYKLLDYYKPSDCKTLHDEFNCRVLFEFTSSRLEHKTASYQTFTLSYNYKTKTFISLHDLSLVKAFSSKHKSYSYRNKLIELFNTENSISTNVVYADMNINDIFGSATTPCIIVFGSNVYKTQSSQFGIAIVMFPRNAIREAVNSVKYVSSIIKNYIENQSEEVEDPEHIYNINEYDVILNPQDQENPQEEKVNPVTSFYIITDSCISTKVNTNVNDKARPDIGHDNPDDDKYYRKEGTHTTPMTPSSLMDYKGFKYDMGFWTSNYFRNNINKNDIYGYNDTVSRALGMDRNSLVYGRYFILVFDFKVDTPVKFEEIFMNIDKY